MNASAFPIPQACCLLGSRSRSHRPFSSFSSSGVLMLEGSSARYAGRDKIRMSDIDYQAGLGCRILEIVRLDPGSGLHLREAHLLLKHTLHTYPISTTLRWQKQAARKSTPPALGMTILRLAVASGKNAIMRYCSSPSGRSGFMYTPPVASLACCSSTVSPASFNISMAIRFLCAANMLFMTGIY